MLFVLRAQIAGTAGITAQDGVVAQLREVTRLDHERGPGPFGIHEVSGIDGRRSGTIVIPVLWALLRCHFIGIALLAHFALVIRFEISVTSVAFRVCRLSAQIRTTWYVRA